MLHCPLSFRSCLDVSSSYLNQRDVPRLLPMKNAFLVNCPLFMSPLTQIREMSPHGGVFNGEGRQYDGAWATLLDTVLDETPIAFRASVFLGRSFLEDGISILSLWTFRKGQ